MLGNQRIVVNDITEFVQKQLKIFSVKRIFDTKEKTCLLQEMLLVWTIMAIPDGIVMWQAQVGILQSHQGQQRI